MITHVMNITYPKSKEILFQNYNFSIVKTIYKITIQKPVFKSSYAICVL